MTIIFITPEKTEKCKTVERNFKNNKYGIKNYERCKENFYLNKKDNLCYSNQKNNDFYKCFISDNNGKALF